MTTLELLEEFRAAIATLLGQIPPDIARLEVELVSNLGCRPCLFGEHESPDCKCDIEDRGLARAGGRTFPIHLAALVVIRGEGDRHKSLVVLHLAFRTWPDLEREPLDVTLLTTGGLAAHIRVDGCPPPGFVTMVLVTAVLDAAYLAGCTRLSLVGDRQYVRADTGDPLGEACHLAIADDRFSSAFVTWVASRTSRRRLEADKRERLARFRRSRQLRERDVLEVFPRVLQAAKLADIPVVVVEDALCCDESVLGKRTRGRGGKG